MRGTGTFLRTIWDEVARSLWLIPSVMFLVGLALAALLLQVDAGTGTPAQAWIGSGQGEDARNLLSTLLTAIITMASMAFSVTVVALSLAANSFGPRLIRVFRSSLRTQIVLGTFILTIVYMLVVLRAIRGDMDVADVPHVAVTFGTVLALACVIALLAFIHGVSRSVVADHVVKRVRNELDAAVAALPPAPDTAEPLPPALPEHFEMEAERLLLPREGYVQAVDYGAVVDWAAERDVLIRLDFRPGDFVVNGDRKVLILPPPADPEKARREIDHFITCGQERTPTQDLEFAIRHLVEVAVRALSPGINDPFTAIAVVDRLRGGLSRLAARRLPPETLRDKAGRLRVVRRVTSYSGAVDAAFHQIRQAAAEKPAVLIHMLEAIGEVAEHVRTEEQTASLIRHARLIRSAGRRAVPEPEDVEDIERAFKTAAAKLRAGNATGVADAQLR